MCAGVNPFNLTTHLSLAQLRQQWYNCAGRVYSTSSGSDGRAVDVVMVCFLLSSQECENLARNDTRTIQMFHIEHVDDFQDREMILFEGEYNFDLGLARCLITLNAQDVIELPDCSNIDFVQFVEVCGADFPRFHHQFDFNLGTLDEQDFRMRLLMVFTDIVNSPTHAELHNLFICQGCLCVVIPNRNACVAMCCNRPFHIDCYRTDPCSGCLVGLRERISCLHPGESNLNHDPSRASIRPRLPFNRFGRIWTRRPWLLPNRSAPAAPIFFN